MRLKHFLYGGLYMVGLFVVWKILDWVDPSPRATMAAILILTWLVVSMVMAKMDQSARKR